MTSVSINKDLNDKPNNDVTKLGAIISITLWATIAFRSANVVLF